MYVNTQQGVEGDTARLLSPNFKIKENECLEYWTYLKLSSAGNMDSLKVSQHGCMLD